MSKLNAGGPSELLAQVLKWLLSIW